MKDEARFRLAGFVGMHAINALLGTLRIRIMAPQPLNGPVIYTLWHGRLLPLTWLHRNQGISTIISRSGDGEYIARVVERWGYHIARGSSSRGGSEALRELVKAGRSGSSLAITPDGPRGPRQKLKRGVLTAAQMTGLPLMPMTGSASRAWWFESWDRFLVPQPFATLYVRYGAPIYVPRDANEATLVAIEHEAERALNELTEQVDADARA